MKKRKLCKLKELSTDFFVYRALLNRALSENNEYKTLVYKRKLDIVTKNLRKRSRLEGVSFKPID